MSPPRRHRAERVLQRRPQVLVAFGAVLAALTLWSVASRQTASVQPQAIAPGAIAAVDAQEASATCGGLGDRPGATQGQIDLVNSTHSARTAIIVASNDLGKTGRATLTIPPGTTTAFAPARLAQGGFWVAATVLVNGGGVGVFESLNASGNASFTPCASTTGTTWFFTNGSTQNNQTYAISLVNPTATSAVVDTSFTSPAGYLAPQNAQGIVVPPHGLVVLSGVNLAPHETPLTTTVRATQGSIAAFATQVLPSPNGASVTIGQSSLLRRIAFSRGVASPGATQSLVLANPTRSLEYATIRIRLKSGWLAPVTQSIQPYSTLSYATVPSSRLATNDVYSALVTVKGPGVISTLATQVAGAASGGWGNAIASTPSSLSARHWLLVGDLGVSPKGVTFFNPGPTPVSMQVSVINYGSDQPLSGLKSVVLQPGSSMSLTRRIASVLRTHSLAVSANGDLSMSEDFPGASASSIGNMVSEPRL